MHGWTLLHLAPGLWVLLLGSALDRVLRRGFEPVPARVWAVFAAVLLVFFGPVLFLDNTLLPLGRIGVFPPFQELPLETVDDNGLQRDLTHAITPWQAQVRRSLRRGEWPLWNPYSGTGQPLLANPQAMPFHPLVLAGLPVALPAAVGVVAALRVLVAMVFTFLLLRRQGISEIPALGGGLAFGLGGFVMLWLGWPHVNSAATLPVVLYATLGWSQEERRRDLLLLTVGLFSVLAAGHPETALYVLIVAGLFALARVRETPRDRRWSVLGGWAAAAVLAGLLAAPLLLPAASYLRETTRYHHLVARNERIASQLFSPLRWQRGLWTLDDRLVPVVAPNAHGNNRFGSYWGRHNVNEAAGGFVGSLTLLAALAALASRRGRRFPQELFMAGAALACLLVLVRPPGFVELTVHLPLVDKSPTFHRRTLMVLGFALAYLAACTWERWRRGELPRARVGGLAALLAGLVTWGYLATANPDEPQALAGLRWGSLAVQLSSLGLGTALLLRAGPPRWGAWGLVGLVAAELVVFHRPVNPPVPRSHFYPPSPPLTFLQEVARDEPGAYRMMGLHSALPPEFATLYGLEDVRALGPSQAQTMHLLTLPLRSAGGFLISQLEHPLLDLLGVRWVLAEERWRLPPPARPVFRDVHGVVWERPTALPRLFLPATAEAPAGPWWRWTATNPDYRSRALTTSSADRPLPWRARLPEASQIAVEGLAETHLAARAQLAERRLLATSVFQDGGWRLLVDGAPRPTTLANGQLVAAWLPAGDRRLDLVYRPPGFVLGSLLAGLALTALVAVAAGREPDAIRTAPAARRRR